MYLSYLFKLSSSLRIFRKFSTFDGKNFRSDLKFCRRFCAQFCAGWGINQLMPQVLPRICAGWGINQLMPQVLRRFLRRFLSRLGHQSVNEKDQKIKRSKRMTRGGKKTFFSPTRLIQSMSDQKKFSGKKNFSNN